MSSDRKGQTRRDPPIQAVGQVLLEEARQISCQVLEKLRALEEKYPGAVPAKALEELAAFLAHPDWDRRASQRCPPAAGAVEVCRVDGPRGRMSARLVDCSAWGVGIRLPRPVPVGSHLEVVPLDDDIPVTTVEVRYCRADAGGWLAGCQVLGAAVTSER